MQCHLAEEVDPGSTTVSRDTVSSTTIGVVTADILESVQPQK